MLACVHAPSCLEGKFCELGVETVRKVPNIPETWPSEAPQRHRTARFGPRKPAKPALGALPEPPFRTVSLRSSTKFACWAFSEVAPRIHREFIAPCYTQQRSRRVGHSWAGHSWEGRRSRNLIMVRVLGPSWQGASHSRKTYIETT